MKKRVFVIWGLVASSLVFSQTARAQVRKHAVGETYYSQCLSFEISRPLKELASEISPTTDHRIEGGEVDRPRNFKFKGNSAAFQGPDPIAQTTMGTAALSSPGVNWTGQNNGGGGYPLDPTGAAGITTYVQAVNTSFRAFDKSSGLPLMGVLSLNTLWPNSTNDGDPVVLYDKYADRWFIEQFQIRTNPQKILIAISTSNDPTGTYYKYTFVPDGSDSPDYPKFSIWPDGYYMTANWGNKQKVTVFDRNKMLAGNATAGLITQTFPSALPEDMPSNPFFSPLPADADGMLPPVGTPISIFAFEDDNWGVPAVKDQIHILKMTTDWVNPTNTTLVEDSAGGSPLATAPFNSYWPNSMTEISQQGTSQGLDALAGVFMFRAQYRRWTSYNSMVLNNVVNVNTATGQSGIRWYELRQDIASGKWSIYQQGTYAPDGENRWMASMAMDDNGAIGMAYSIAGATHYPGIAYTGRAASDPLGVMTFTEQQAITGAAAQVNIDRWGDYSHTSLDPDGLTFWHTGMWESGNGQETQIFNFAINGSAGISEKGNTAATYACYFLNAQTLIVTANQLFFEEGVVVDLFAINGELIRSMPVTPVGGAFQLSLPISGLARGAYLVRIGNPHFQKILKTVLN